MFPLHSHLQSIINVQTNLHYMGTNNWGIGQIFYKCKAFALTKICWGVRVKICSYQVPVSEEIRLCLIALSGKLLNEKAYLQTLEYYCELTGKVVHVAQSHIAYLVSCAMICNLYTPMITKNEKTGQSYLINYTLNHTLP